MDTTNNPLIRAYEDTECKLSFNKRAYLDNANGPLMRESTLTQVETFCQGPHPCLRLACSGTPGRMSPGASLLTPDVKSYILDSKFIYGISKF